MRALVVGSFVFTTLFRPCLAQEPAGWDAALARYKECIARIPFTHHTEGRDRIAQTRSLTALTMLAADYTRVKDKGHYPEESRYTIASLIGRHLSQAAAVEPLVALRQQADKPADTWLWVQALRIQADHGGEEAVIKIATEAKSALHRAAAIAAIGESRGGNLKAAVLPNVLNFPKKEKEGERMALLGAMTGAFWDNRTRVNDTDYREALKGYIGLLAEGVGLSHTAKVQMARHLQEILKTPGMFINPEPYLEVLERGSVKQPKANSTTAAPRFFGVETDGEQFCYVVDMSDSMCKPIEPSAIPPGITLTGPKKKVVKRKGQVLDESDIPWHLIKTRWDLARENLKISLSRLTPEKSFAIVWFGTESGTLDTTKGMIRATPANVSRVMAELDTLVVKPKDKLTPDELVVSPDGKLRGKTNMHSGLRRAFSLAGKGFVEAAAYVDPEALTEGCDTIFLLSDGAPSIDDYYVLDKDYGEGNVVVDQEYGAKANRTPQLWYPGPYVSDQWLVEDTRRMNSLRRIKIHCIGLGEANKNLLDRLADMGNGTVFIVGEKKAGAAGGNGGSDGGAEPKK
jgi:hypothetical protein